MDQRLGLQETEVKVVAAAGDAVAVCRPIQEKPLIVPGPEPLLVEEEEAAAVEVLPRRHLAWELVLGEAAAMDTRHINLPQ